MRVDGTVQPDCQAAASHHQESARRLKTVLGRVPSSGGPFVLEELQTLLQFGLLCVLSFAGHCRRGPRTWVPRTPCTRRKRGNSLRLKINIIGTFYSSQDYGIRASIGRAWVQTLWQCPLRFRSSFSLLKILKVPPPFGTKFNMRTPPQLKSFRNWKQIKNKWPKF